MKTKSPYPALMAQLVKLSIVPKAYVEKVGDQKFNLEPIGSGPYKLASWQKGVQSHLDANETYWRGKPPFRTRHVPRRAGRRHARRRPAHRQRRHRAPARPRRSDRA